MSIKNEISIFSNNCFKNIESITDDHIKFIEKNELYEPKENYTSLFKYLNPLYNHFKNIDSMIVNSTLSKLHRDFEYIQKVYSRLQNETKDLKYLFEKKFIYTSNILKTVDKEINRYKNISNISIHEKQKLKELTIEYEKLKSIYFLHFEDFFIEDKKYFLSLLLRIFNTKTYYLDKLLWMQVSHSQSILRTLRTLNNNNEINSKIYISYRLTIILPYSKDYAYLQKCLRIFK